MVVSARHHAAVYPLSGSWLNLAEAIQRILKRRALAGQHPHSPAEIGVWFEQTAQAWTRQPTPFLLCGTASVDSGAMNPEPANPSAVPQRIPGDLSRAAEQAIKNTEYRAK